MLSPIHFLLYINDLFDLPVKCRIMSYADDTKLLQNEQDSGSLQEDLDTVFAWYYISINTKKSKVIRFGGSVEEGFNYRVDGLPLEFVSLYKDLGVLIDNKFSFERQVAAIVRKAFYILNSIRYGLLTKDKHILLNLYKIYVLPIVEYCVPIWSPRFRYFDS